MKMEQREMNDTVSMDLEAGTLTPEALAELQPGDHVELRQVEPATHQGIAYPHFSATLVEVDGEQLVAEINTPPAPRDCEGHLGMGGKRFPLERRHVHEWFNPEARKIEVLEESIESEGRRIDGLEIAIQVLNDEIEYELWEPSRDFLASPEEVAALSGMYAAVATLEERLKFSKSRLEGNKESLMLKLAS